MAKRCLLIICAILLLCVPAYAEKAHIIWSDFSSGELSPLLDGQVNLEKYYSGAKRLENFLPLPQGPAQRRTGFQYIGSTKNGATEKARLVPFVYSNEQAYALEFGPLYIRFWRNGEQVFNTHTDIKLLIHPETGTEGDASQAFKDDSSFDKTITVGGHAQMDDMSGFSSSPQIGDLAILYDGTGDFLSLGDSDDWNVNASDWTVAGWIRPDKRTDTPQTIWGQDSVADASIDTTFVRLSLEKYTGLLLNGNFDIPSTEGVITDSSLNTKTVSNVGATGVTINTSSKKFGDGALEFDGTTYLSHAGDSDFDIGATGSTNVFTIEGFANPTVEAGIFYIFELYQDANNFLYLRHTGSDVIATYRADGGTVTTLNYGGGANWVTGSYNHFAVVGDGTNFSLYLKGTRVATTTFPVGEVMDDMSSDAIRIGADNAGANFYIGLIDDFKFSLNARYSGTTLTVPTSEDKNVAHLKFEISNTGSADSIEDSDDTITTVKFHHFEVSEDTAPSGTTYLFTDGALTTSKAMTEDPGGALAGLLYIGIDVDGASKDYDGWIDEFVFIKGQFLHSTSFNVPTTTYNAILGTSPVEVTTTYLESSLFQLKFAQSADVLYIAHPDYAPRKLLRFSDTSWRFKTIPFLPPPLQREKEDPNDEVTFTQKEVGATIATTDAGAGGTLFATGDVGREIREDGTVGTGRATIIAVADADTATSDIFQEFSSTSPDAGTWEFIGSSTTGTLTITGNYDASATHVNLNEIVTLTSNKNVFVAGDVGKYLTTDDGTGIIIYKILTYISATAVEGVSLVGDAYSTNLVLAVNEWELKTGSWSGTEGAATDGNGYPASVAFFENRLCWAGTYAELSTLWCSAVDNYENHDLDEDAYSFTLSGPHVNKIVWLQPSDSLLIGTTGDEWVLGNRGASEPVSPDNVVARVQSVYGSANVQPVGFGQVILFLEKGGKKVRELSYDFDTDKYVSPDVTLLAEHITNDGLIELDFSITPFPIMWGVRSDGALAGLTYNRTQKIVAWHKHVTDGTFESVAVIPGNIQDELWVIVNRTINSATVRYIERLANVFDSTTLNDAFFVDSGKTYSLTPAASSVTGLSHLEGESVQILADGIVFDDATVSNGAITLKLDTVTTVASDVHAGLPFTSYLQTMRPELKDDMGTIQGRKKNINRIVLRLKDAKQYKYGPTPSGTLKEKTHTSLFSGDTEPPLPFQSGNTEEAYVTVVQEEPLPITVIAILPEINIP